MRDNGTITYVSENVILLKINTEAQLIDVWPFVRQGIEHIKRRDKSARLFSVQQVFAAIRYGLPNAQPRTTAVELYVSVDPDKRLSGFMVVEPNRDPFRNGIQTGIYIWLLYASGELIQKFLPEMEKICKAVGGDQIVFHSGRRGWFKKIAKYGFKCDQWRMVRQVTW